MSLDLPDDARDLLHELDEQGASYVVVGAHALAIHGYSRGTADLDLLVGADPDNARRVHRALIAFGAPVRAHGLTEDDLARSGTVYQLGLPPYRIDILTSIDGVSFEQAWAGRFVVEADGQPVPFLGRAELLMNKRSTGRTKDLADAEALERLGPMANDTPG